ncbi:MAG: selenocysteine-specific translation elongation factor [Candidatus Cloacimonetes bacterium]|nr:selenocysteine-specific translation elongation factor [Candidatus Cloacimonadota bacterium]
MNKHFILGTAGHIDHGKTTLVKALSGFDCDTHKEEKLRGITIHLGFTHIALTPEHTVSVVDVPGHADFVDTMVSGSSGIDAVMLVIAADSGVMPQTVEHLQIMSMLGIPTGFVVLTKVDLVDSELIDFASREIRELLEGTFLADAPIIPFSSRTNEGLEQIREAVLTCTEAEKPQQERDVFRMYIDRIFQVKGHGTVVNGSVLGGNVSKGDKVVLLPEGKEYRIRRLERHCEETDSVLAGDRASLSLPGLERSEVTSGSLIADRTLEATTLIDALLKFFPGKSSLNIWSQLHFLLGTVSQQVRIHLINVNKLRGGEEALVQIHLARPAVVQHGDRFIVRSSSADITLGGGEIIDAHPLHHRRRPEPLIKKMAKLSAGGVEQLIAEEVRKSIVPLTSKQIADRLGVTRERTVE